MKQATIEGLGRLWEVEFEQRKNRDTIVAIRPVETRPAGAVPLPKEWKAALQAAFRGEKPQGARPPLQPGGTDFQKKVWRALEKIPVGRTRTYGEIAEALGNRGSARAVGTACAANPIPFLIPCHRVLPAGGGTGNYAHGSAMKAKLLALEGAQPR